MVSNKSHRAFVAFGAAWPNFGQFNASGTACHRKPHLYQSGAIDIAVPVLPEIKNQHWCSKKYTKLNTHPINLFGRQPKISEIKIKLKKRGPSKECNWLTLQATQQQIKHDSIEIGYKLSGIWKLHAEMQASANAAIQNGQQPLLQWMKVALRSLTL